MTVEKKLFDRRKFFKSLRVAGGAVTLPARSRALTESVCGPGDSAFSTSTVTLSNGEAGVPSNE